MLDDKQLEEYEAQIRSAKLEAEQSKLNQTRQDVMIQDQDKSMITEQLDVSEILNNMYYLLKGYILKRDDNGYMTWNKPENNDMIILSDYGVNYVLGSVQWYVNKNTLLSNYEDVTILEKMEDFATTISDNVFMDYEHMFCYPTLDDCKRELEDRIRNRIDIKKFADELTGRKQKSHEGYKVEVMLEMEDRIEHEFAVIKQQKLKSKLKRFESIIRFVQDVVHSAYQRAWNGQERRTLREHIHISESKGGFPIGTNKPQFTMNPMKAFG